MSRFNNLEFKERTDEAAAMAAAVKDEAYYWREAEAAFQAADFEKALRAYSQVLEFNPQNAAAWTGQVRALIELEEFREAKIWADKALEHFPQEAELLAAKAVALGRMGNFKDAMAFSDAAIAERGNTPYIWLARGDILLGHKEQRCQYCFDKALAYAPASWVIRWLIARIYFYYRQFALALQQIQEALSLDEGQCAIWLHQGNCQAALGMIQYAWGSYQQAWQLNPNCLEAKAAMDRLEKSGFWERLGARFKSLFSSTKP